MEWQNKRIQYSGSGKELYPDKCGYFRKGFICTHVWGHRYRGNNSRISQTRNTDCRAMFNAQLVHIGGDVQVKIFKQISEHNHLCSLELYNTYHEQRRLIDLDTLGVVEKMLEFKMERGQIWQYIRSQGKKN